MRNPLMFLAFLPGPVTVLTTVTYVALLLALLITHLTVPHVADLGAVGAADTTSLAEAWLDLANLTRHHHPYNSHNNDQVRRWLLERVREILKSNGVAYDVDYSGGVTRSDVFVAGDALPGSAQIIPHAESLPVVIFDDTISNVTAVQRVPPYNRVGKYGDSAGAYFEGNNIAIYIRGSEDPAGDWWATPAKSYGKGGVLVNAHFDSVSTSFGATDDGVGVVSLLQLLRHFTHPETPKPPKGIVLLFNNNEEDMLWGARAFGYSPLLPFITTFVNLEGAGAGGRAILFRTTDQQVTEAYAHSPHPFGSVIGSDAFKLKVIRSDTDYSVWDKVYGQRGVDIAFYTPRGKYHTKDDDTRHTSKDSVAHMLEAAIATTAAMAADTSSRFSGARPDGDRDKAQNGTPADGVWFDMFGKGFAVFALRGLFAWSLTLLVVTPLALAAVTFILVRRDQYYFFARNVTLLEQALEAPVGLGGWKGAFRFPLAVIVAGGVTIGVAFLVGKVNPFIICSSEYAVWSMIFSLVYLVFWITLRIANTARPSALQRGFVHVWLFALGWVVLVVATVYEDRFAVASGYLVVFLQSAIFVASLITLLDFLALPSKADFALEVNDMHQLLNEADGASRADRPLLAPAPRAGSAPATNDNSSIESDSEPDENTPLRAGGSGGNGIGSATTTFRTTIVDASRRSISTFLENREANKPYGLEQTWAGKLPSLTWLVQWLALAPITIILFGQVGLFVITAVSETASEGGSTMFPYLVLTMISFAILLPITPFIHRVTFHLPLVLLVVFVATLVYNLAAFPFSPSRPHKVFFQHRVDLDAGTNRVTYTGVEEYVHSIIGEMPSAFGQDITCEPHRGRGLTTCSYDGSTISPKVGSPSTPNATLDGLIVYNITRDDGAVNRATIHVDADNTRSCMLLFNMPITRFHVHGSAGRDNRFYTLPDGGIELVRLYRRDRSTPWAVDFKWAGDASDISGQVACMWDDVNTEGAIPSFEEAIHYIPRWATLTKLTLGLVEIRKRFDI